MTVKEAVLMNFDTNDPVWPVMYLVVNYFYVTRFFLIFLILSMIRANEKFNNDFFQFITQLKRDLFWVKFFVNAQLKSNSKMNRNKICEKHS